MANRVVFYLIAHQPRRPRLPAPEIPKGFSPEEMADLLFDSSMNRRYLEKVASTCYYPALRFFSEQLEKGLHLSLGLSWSLVEQLKTWQPELLELFKQVIAHPRVELIGVEPYHSFLFYLDIRRFQERMAWMRDQCRKEFGKTPQVTDTTEMFLSNDIYYALRQLGFRGCMMDGREWVMSWRQPSYLYHYEEGLKIFCRHYRLSDDVGYRFSDRSWPGWPLMADTYVYWIKETEGDLVFLGWDFETFGEHHPASTGIFDFFQRFVELLEPSGIVSMTPSQVLEDLGDKSFFLPLPQFPSTWAGSGGVEFFLGNPIQQALFQLMHHTYNKARLTGNPNLEDLALWLLMSDNLHLMQWYGRSGSEAEVSAYFTPREWWSLGPEGIASEIQKVYQQFITALDEYIP